MSASNRIASISGIKAIALVLVFVWHCGVLQTPDLGARMCELFFVCSGVLEALNHHGNYSYTLDETVSITKKKLAGVYPLYLVTFLLAALLGAVGLKKWTIRDNTIAAVINLMMLQPWFSNLQFSFNGVSWFVADLMLCYLITPLLSWCIRRRESAANTSPLRCYLAPLSALFIIRMLLQVAEYRGVIDISNHSFPLSRMLEYSMAFVAGTIILARGGGYPWIVPDAKTLCNRFLRGSGVCFPLCWCAVFPEWCLVVETCMCHRRHSLDLLFRALSRSDKQVAFSNAIREVFDFADALLSFSPARNRRGGMVARYLGRWASLDNCRGIPYYVGYFSYVGSSSWKSGTAVS